MHGRHEHLRRSCEREVMEHACGALRRCRAWRGGEAYWSGVEWSRITALRREMAAGVAYHCEQRRQNQKPSLGEE